MGGIGADKMIGGKGDDIYLVDNTGDVVTENAAEGIDEVRSSIKYTLGSNVENLVLTGTAAVNGIGNALNNTLTGNSAANVLAGGTGNDTYYVGAGDTVTENSSAGTDTVIGAVSWTLGLNIEDLVLAGTAAINGTGNASANRLTGNSAANSLSGSGGNDVLEGGGGNDTLNGGSGNDAFRFAGLNGGVDSIADFLSGTDKIQVVGSGFGLTAGVAVKLIKAATTPAASGTDAQFLYNTTSGALYFDRDGTNAAYTPVQIATLTGQITLVASDFVVVDV